MITVFVLSKHTKWSRALHFVCLHLFILSFFAQPQTGGMCVCAHRDHIFGSVINKKMHQQNAALGHLSTLCDWCACKLVDRGVSWREFQTVVSANSQVNWHTLPFHPRALKQNQPSNIGWKSTRVWCCDLFVWTRGMSVLENGVKLWDRWSWLERVLVLPTPV